MPANTAPPCSREDPIRLVRMVNKSRRGALSAGLLHHPHKADGVGERGEAAGFSCHSASPSAQVGWGRFRVLQSVVEDGRNQDLEIYDLPDFSKDPGDLDGMIDVRRRALTLPFLVAMLVRGEVQRAKQAGQVRRQGSRF